MNNFSNTMPQGFHCQMTLNLCIPSFGAKIQQNRKKNLLVSVNSIAALYPIR